MSLPSSQTPITATRWEVEEGLKSPNETKVSLTLGEKLDEYLTRLGYTTASVTTIVVQLLTHGKVQVDFADHAERLELLNRANICTATQATRFLEEHVAKAAAMRGVPRVNPATQRVVVPGILRPR